MKRIIYLFAIATLLTFISGCEEDKNEPLFKDSQPPSKISNPQVENLPGAAVISYTLPTDEDLLYVKAEYTLSNGVKAEAKSSNFLSSLRVEGFGNTEERSVILYAVDRSENVSDPVEVKVNPELPDVHAVNNTIEMVPDFGGVQFRWTNENNAPLAFMIFATDSTGKLSEVQTVYSAITDGQFTIRGYDPVETEFAMVVRDRWDNYSEMSTITVTPLFEEELDKNKFNKIVLDNDQDWSAWEGRYEFSYDGDPNTFNHTWAGTGWPQYWTVDLGVTARLSRFILQQRQTFFYRHGNLRLFDVWGSKDEPAQDGSLENWYPLRVAAPPYYNGCVSIRPSEQGGTADEDQEHFENGDEFSFTLDDPEIRYIRIVVNETWGLTGFSHFGEITFFGQVVEL
ncbi:DUF4959 domain-containing protein [Prolixibacteraceae bacterium Z1-6]|uniref:DUF4959 domain-containing protein n=1 Tax=Draconibacterium aestuarii TaxID=2998507 RepID=A0A9X3FGV8_9BACT|nr:DUF4959 domain-containing protein [Prolixibacteraceae bacterium Z1-6]